MSSLRSPVGPLPPKIYWRRRLVVLLALAAVIVVIVLIVAKPGASDAGQQTPPTSAPTTTAPTPPAEPAACKRRDVEVTPVVDATSYGKRDVPALSFSIENTGEGACDYNAGSSQQEFIITSGDDLIWSSADCQRKPRDEVVTLQPGEPVSSASIEWDRTRSSPDTCDVEREPVVAGGATYNLTVSVGEAVSENPVSFLLY